MGLADELTDEVDKIVTSEWQTREGREVPDSDSLQLGNDALTLDATVLYADLAESTKLVDEKKPTFAAEVYKSFLHCASKIIRAHEGEITAFDGDRVMAVYLGDSKNSNAAQTALKINWAVKEVITPKLKEFYNTTYEVKHAVGIDTSSLFVARTGIRGANDLVWVGRAANYAAKLSGLREGGYTSWISKAVFDVLNKDAKYSRKDGSLMWEQRTWGTMTIYRSNWWRSVE